MLKIKFVALFAFGVLITRAERLHAQNESDMKQTGSSKETLASFFKAFGNGDFQEILDVFDPNVQITAVRNENVKEGMPYGKFEEIEGVKSFITGLGNTFDTKAFNIHNLIGEGETAFANGSFTHQVKATGKIFTSDWAVMCKVEDGKITEFHFYEDSQKFAEANTQ